MKPTPKRPDKDESKTDSMSGSYLDADSCKANSTRLILRLGRTWMRTSYRMPIPVQMPTQDPHADSRTRCRIQRSIPALEDQLYFDNFKHVHRIISKPNISDDKSHEQEKMENNNRTLKELATPNVLYQPWCIHYLQLELAQSFKLKYGLIHLLPKFHCLVGEDPHKHMKEFHVFPESQPFGRRFVGSGNIQEKHCTNTGKDSTNCAPHVHTIKSLNNCLMMMDRNMIGVASGEALMDKTPAIARQLISSMPSNMQQFETRGAITSKW
ncbi:hypothetical protein CR513_23960, partial [Mucuna pruriens]